MSACFMASEIGIPHGEGLENHASYLKSWLDQMKGDANYIFNASKMASATTDFLLAFVREPEAVRWREVGDAPLGESRAGLV